MLRTTAVAALAACSVVLAAGAASADTKDMKIAFSNNYAGNSWRQAMLKSYDIVTKKAVGDGIVAAADVFTTADKEVPTQAAQIQNLILQGYNAIVINASSPDALNGAIKQACDAGIVVVSFDGIVTEPCAWRVVVDFKDMGKQEVEQMAKFQPKGGNLLEIRGLAGTTVLGNGQINLKIEPEVSELDQSHPVQIAGYNVPPLIVRRASTTVELRDGQSFALGGLLQNKSATAQQQLPWLGDVPVLGMLFRSAAYQKNETDLAIIVTPRLVRPARPGDAIKTPLDNAVPGNDADFFLAGKAELPRGDLRTETGAERPYSGHVLDLPKGDNNVVASKN